MGSNLGLENIDEMMVQISRDHSRLDAELNNVRAEIKLKDNDLLAINKQLELTERESNAILKRIRTEKEVADELYNKEVKMREEIFGTETDFKSSKLWNISGLRSELQQAKMRKEHSMKKVQCLDDDINMHRKQWEQFEAKLPIIQKLAETKCEVAALQRKLEEMYMQGNIDEIKQEVEHLKETITFQNQENDRSQEESVNKKKEKKLLDNRKLQLSAEIRSLENRSAAKKKKLSKTIEDLTSQLLIKTSSAEKLS